MHIELINPREKLSTELGGTGYTGPTEPAKKIDLYVDAQTAREQFPDLDFTVWKVLRSSTGWHRRYATTRRLRIEGKTLPCKVIGGNREWWWVSVVASDAVRVLTD